MPRRSKISMIDPCPFDPDILCNSAKMSKDLKDKGVTLMKCKNCSYIKGQVRF